MTERRKSARDGHSDVFEVLIDHSPDIIVQVDRDLRYISVNPALERLSGVPRARFIGRTVREMGLEPEEVDYLERAAHKAFSTGERVTLRFPFRGRSYELQAVPVPAAEGRVPSVFLLSRDVTERERAEAALRESEETNRSILNTSADAIFLADIKGTLRACNPQTARMLGYASAAEIIGKSALNILAPEERPIALETINRILAGESTLRMEHNALRKDGSTFPMEFSISAVRSARGETLGMTGVGRDITERRVAEQKLKQSYERLKGTTEGIISSISRLVELRDPYTAGHQRRVSQLAYAVARAMSLPLDRAEGIRIAGLLHDVGKMYVPSEILSKPSRLSEVEFSVIKLHPGAGHDILKSIPFDWPVAEVTWQHQERLDGSGYPRGLSGDDILLETRIVSVADTVEAMTFHRPYRTVVGLRSALDEIAKDRGRLFEPSVVDTCLGLFERREFSFA